MAPKSRALDRESISEAEIEVRDDGQRPLIDHELFAVWLKDYSARLEATRRQGQTVRSEITTTLALHEEIRDRLTFTRLDSESRALQRAGGPLRAIIARWCVERVDVEGVPGGS